MNPCRVSLKGLTRYCLGIFLGFLICWYVQDYTKMERGEEYVKAYYQESRPSSTEKLLEKWKENELQVRIIGKGEKILASDPRLLQYIRDYVLIPPLPKNVPYKLSHPENLHFSQFSDQSIFLNGLFGNSIGGFFIEAGAYDGEALSNTLWLERERNWTGLLIEPDLTNLASVKGKQRKAWLAHSCLSPVPYPQKMSLEGGDYGGKMVPEKEGNGKGQNLFCYPLESLLRAIGQLQVDFFSLDIEGLDYEVLASIPWHVLDIKVLMVESNKGSRDKILKLMTEKAYRHTKALTIDDVFERP